MSNPETKTFEGSDKLSLKPFCERLERFLLVEHDYVEGSLVAALNASFGSGKTTFLEMWKNDLLARRDKGEFCPMPVVLNAWESDYCGDPLVAILAGLLQAVEQWHGTDAPKNQGALKEAAKDVAWFGMALLNDVAAKATGIDAFKAAEIAEKKKSARKEEMPDFIKIFNSRKAALDKLKTLMAEAFQGDAPKVLVFVDELDRCRPDYAISYLETIKHVFNVKGMVFVLAVDYPQLTASAESIFGDRLDVDEYFRKFCHRVFQLPLPQPSGYEQLTQDYVGKYLRLEGRRSSLLKLDEHLCTLTAELTSGLKMRPRQVQEAFRILGHTVSTMDAERTGNINWALGFGTLWLSLLRVANRQMFQKIASGSIHEIEVCRNFIEVVGKDKGEWWVKLYLTGISNEGKSETHFKNVLSELGYFTHPDGNLREYLNGFRNGWGHYPDQIKRICSKIESAETF